MEDARELIAAAVAASRFDSAADDRLLIEWLANHNAPCPLCGYNLRALRMPRCPECAQRLRLSVALVDSTLGPWIALIVALLLPAGPGTLIIVLFLYALAREGLRMLSFSSLPPFFLGMMLAHLVLSVPLSALALIYRRQFLTRSMKAQRACAIVAWGAVAVTILTAILEAFS